MSRRVLAFGVSLFSFLLLASNASGQIASEYQVKALFLYNFVKFVDWPPDAFASAHDPVTICVVGEDPFGRDLEQALKGKTVNGRELAVRRPSKDFDVKGCQIAFVSSSEKKRFKPLLVLIDAMGILTVGDSGGFTDAGGIINFTMESGKVRFEVNLEGADRAGLKISSKLLGVAKIVKEGGKR